MASLKGQLLVAPPKMFDPNFFRTVVLMIQHNEQGALGLVLNRPLEKTMKEVWEQVSESSCELEARLHSGGPCDGPLMVLHGLESAADEAVEVLPGVYFATDRDAIEQLVEKANEDSPLRFFVGYAGWSAGQLESELEEGGWLIAEATAQAVFSDCEDLWVSTFRALTKNVELPGVNPKCIPEDPSLN